MKPCGEYPDFMVRAMLKAGVKFPTRVIQNLPPGRLYDRSETDLEVARWRIQRAVARAECNAVRAKIRAMILNSQV